MMMRSLYTSCEGDVEIASILKRGDGPYNTTPSRVLISYEWENDLLERKLT